MIERKRAENKQETVRNKERRITNFKGWSVERQRTIKLETFRQSTVADTYLGP
jgi:hypothetical protein